MLRIAAVDDEYHVLERLERMLLGIEDVEICGLFETGETLLSYLETGTLDAIFLDIEMPEINGLELAERILELYSDVHIVFITAFNQYAIEAFEVQAIDYILKPITEERLRKTIERLKKLTHKVVQFEKPFIQCIGDFEVFIGKQALGWKNSKAKEMLAFLIQKKGIPVNWEKIADAIWPEFNSEKAQTNFHATTYLLRKRLNEVGLAGILESGRGNYRIVIDQVECDLYLVEALLESGLAKRKEDQELLHQISQKGYLEASGYSWSASKAAELEMRIKRMESLI